jgi:SPP1 gp7 family putative phage head morphogenesis protein
MAIKLQEPVGIRKRYEKALKRYARLLSKAVNDIVIPEVPRIVEMAQRYRPDADGARADAETWIEMLERLLGDTLGIVTSVQERELAAAIGKAPLTAGTPVAAIAKEVSNNNARQISRITQSQYGEGYSGAEPWLDDMLHVWERENLKLITTIPGRYVDDLQGTIVRAVNSGKSATDLSAIIKSTYDVPVKRAQLIANDQVGKLHSQLAQTRQKAIGVKEYIWRGIMDDRERPEHRAREGKTFKWSNPPSDGHPGEAINCRCYGQPIFPPRDKVDLQ